MRIHTSLGPVGVLGDVLFDHFPDHKCLGGASFNFAFHLHRLGVPVHFLSAVGNDSEGKDVLAFANRYGFPIEGIKVIPEVPTGEVKVSLDDQGNPDFEILKDRAFDFIDSTPWKQNAARRTFRLFYFGTLVQRGERSRNSLWELVDVLKTQSLFFVDLNLRAPFYNLDSIERTLMASDILKISDGELQELQRLMSTTLTGDRFLEFLMSRFKIGSVCITSDHTNLLFDAGQSRPYRCPVFSEDPVVDTVGAGDAFSAMFAAGLLAGWPRQTILERSTRFATDVCQVSGALPLEDSFYSPYQFSGS